MKPKSLSKERFDGLKRCVEIDGRQHIPKEDNSTKIRVVSEVSLRIKYFNLEELADLVDEEAIGMNLEIGKLGSRF